MKQILQGLNEVPGVLGPCLHRLTERSSPPSLLTHAYASARPLSNAEMESLMK